METKKTGKDIESLLNMNLDDFFIRYNLGYSAAKLALKCNHIRTVRELCYLSMKDLVVISGHSRTELYDLQEALISAGLDLDMRPEDVNALKDGEDIGDYDFYSETGSFSKDHMLSTIEIGKDENKESRVALIVHRRMNDIHELEKNRFEICRYRIYR